MMMATTLDADSDDYLTLAAAECGDDGDDYFDYGGG